MNIQQFPTRIPSRNPLLSVLIPTWNNLPYLKLCVQSLRENSKPGNLEIVLHINDGSDGSLDWARAEGLVFTWSAENIGICYAVNAARQLARGQWLVYMNDDMYACPGWDSALLRAAGEAGHTLYMPSSTMIEPVDTGNPCVLAPHDFGRSPDRFRKKELLAFARQTRVSDWQGSTWPPVMIHHTLWDRVGGFSPEFSPGMYSDPDLAMKCWQAGVRLFRGVGNSLVYHFQCVSTGRVKPNNGRKTFLKKWGISASTFTRKILERGRPFTGPLPDKPLKAPLKDRVKRLFLF